MTTEARGLRTPDVGRQWGGAHTGCGQAVGGMHTGCRQCEAAVDYALSRPTSCFAYPHASICSHPHMPLCICSHPHMLLCILTPICHYVLYAIMYSHPHMPLCICSHPHLPLCAVPPHAPGRPPTLCAVPRPPTHAPGRSLTLGCVPLLPPHACTRQVTDFGLCTTIAPSRMHPAGH